MRRVFVLILLALTAPPLYAASSQPPLPKGLQPLPPPPAPPPGAKERAGAAPQVTIIKRGAQKIEEYRIHGRLYMVKVTPAHGKPYYLVDREGKGQFTRLDTLNPHISVPQWVLFEF